MMRRLPIVALALLGCDDRAATEIPCTDTRDCPGGLVCVDALCQPPGSCDGDEDCCPGAECVGGACFDREPECTADPDCLDATLRCLDGQCARRTCGECSEGARCVAGHCHRDPPCRGACDEGQVCYAHLDECRPAPAGCGGQSCEPGHVLVVDDPEGYTGATCDLSAGACTCAAVPALVPADFGRHASMAVRRNEALFAAYDADYGDLVFVEGIEAGAPRVRYLDGIPGAPPRADPAGPRGGVTEPGPDRGRYASLAIDPKGRAHIAYYDADAGALRYLVSDEAGAFGEPVVVDDEGDAGRYARLGVDDAGRPHIVYHQATGEAASELRYATRTAEGGGFSILTVSRALAPGHGVHPCLRVGRDGAVYFGFHDVEARWLFLGRGDAGGFEVAALAATPGETWPADPGGRYERLEEHDLGRFCDLAPVFGVGVHAVFLDGTTNALLGYLGPVEGGGALEVVDPGGRGLRRLVGADPALALDPSGRPLVVYQDATENDVLLSVRGGDGWSATPLGVATAGALGFYNSLVVVGDEAVVGTLELRTLAGGRGAHRLHVFRTDIPRF